MWRWRCLAPQIQPDDGDLKPDISPEQAFKHGNQHFVASKKLMSALPLWGGRAVSAEIKNNRRVGILTSKLDVFSTP